MKEKAAPDLKKIAAGSSDAAERKQAVYILAQAAPNDASDALSKALKDPDGSVRAAAAAACGRTGAEELVRELGAALADKDESVRREALYSLVELGESRVGGKPLADLLTTDLTHAKPSVRAKAADLLGERRWSRTDPLVKLLSADDTPWVRASAATALGKLKARPAADALAAALDDDSTRVQNAAKTALEQITGQTLGADPAAWKTWLAANPASDASPQ